MHREFVRRHGSRLETGQVGPSARARVLRDEDQRIWLKIFARHREIDFLRAHAGPGNSSYRRTTGIRVGCNLKSPRKQGPAARKNADGPIARLRCWRESGDRELRSEAQLSGI